MANTKAAKSITINSTKYELANKLDVADGKLQLKAKDVLLSEAELPAGSKYIAITLVRDPDHDVGEMRRGYLIGSVETSGNIDPATYTGQAMANDFLAGGLKIVAFVPSNGWSDNSYIEISELNVFDNTEYPETPDFYYTFLGAGLSTAGGNDTIKYKLSIDGLSTGDTLDTLKNGYHHAQLYNCLDTWVTPSDFIIDLTDGQEMFEFTNTTWTCKSFDADDLKAAIRAGKRIVIRSKNYLDHDDPTTNTMILACTRAVDSYGGNQVMTQYFDGPNYYDVLAPYTSTVTSLNVYRQTH